MIAENMCPENPYGWIFTKFGTAGRLANLITHGNFFSNRLRGFDSVRVEFCHFPISMLSPLTQCWRYHAACDFASL